MIETRDRLRSDRIVETHLLTRHIDYDVDYAAGTLRFREPILSRSSAGDPQFIVADYEVDGIAARTLNAGGRIAVRSADQKLQVAATAIRDADEAGHTDLGGIDVRYRPTAATEIRAEAAVSRTEGRDADATTKAWLVEVEHHAGPIDVLAYASRRDAGFGLRQTNAVESGTRKIGIDARAQLTQDAPILRQRLARGQPDLRRAAHRRSRLARISRPNHQRARRPYPCRRPPVRRPRGGIDPAPARRHATLARRPPRARCADRTSDLRRRRERRFPDAPQGSPRASRSIARSPWSAATRSPTATTSSRASRASASTSRRGPGRGSR